MFFVQNNEYAICVPLAQQTAAPSLAHKGVGYGDARRARRRQRRGRGATRRVAPGGRVGARAGGGPTLVEALTYRIEAHTNADDATRYRPTDEVAGWLARDPITRLEAVPASTGALLDDAAWPPLDAEAEAAGRGPAAADERRRRSPTRRTCSAHVYAEPTPALRRQQRQLAAELAGTAEAGETCDDGARGA